LGTSISSVSAERAQVERQDDLPRRAELASDPARGLDLDPMALVVIDRQRVEAKALLTRQPRRDHRIEPAGE
jgi:hypothetical protein